MKTRSFLPLFFLLLALSSCQKDKPTPADSDTEILPNGWEMVPGPALVRNNHCAVLMSDGRVLISGGQVPAPEIATKSCEIYDPVSNSWTPAAPMLLNRMAHAAILLNDGRVLVMGGYDANNGGAYHKNGEVYDPLTNSWTLTQSMFYQSENPSMVIDSNGNVIIATNRSIDSYNPTKNQITVLRHGPYDSYYSGTSLQALATGAVICMGGGGSALGNQLTRSFKLPNSVVIMMNIPRAHGHSILLPDSSVLLFGGVPESHLGDILDSAEKKWTYTRSSSSSPTALKLFHGKADKVIAFGNTSLEEFTISTGTWSRLESLDFMTWGGGIGNIAVVQLTNGKLFVTGGFNKKTNITEPNAYLYTP